MCFYFSSSQFSLIISLTVSYGPISCFDLEQILTANDNQTLNELHKSKGSYYNWLENNFLVLPDEKTLVGVKSDCYTLQTEDITDNAGPVQIDNQGSSIYSLLFSETTNSLLVGYDNGVAIQYERNSVGTWKVLENYGNLGIGTIRSCDHLGDLAIMGGSGSFKLRVINLKKRQLIGDTLETAIEYIRSLQFCKVSKAKTILVVSGRYPNYSTTSDVFDVSELFKTCNTCEIPQTTDKSPEKDTTSNMKTPCTCLSPVVFQTFLAKVEHHISQIFGHLINKLESQSREITKSNQKSGKMM